MDTQTRKSRPSHRSKRWHKDRRQQRRAFRLQLEQLEERTLLTAAGLDQRIPGEIATPGEVDTFALEVLDKERISVTVDTSPSGTDQLLDGAWVTVRDPADQLLMQTEMLNGDPRVRDLELPTPGVYTIEVRAPSESPERIGGYELHLADRDPEPTPIQFGQSLAGALDVRDRVQLFDLEIGQDQLGTPFTIVVDGDQAVRPVLELFSPEGSLLVSGASGTDVFDTRIADFAARAEDEGGAGAGTYQIRTTAMTDELGYFELGVSDRPIDSPEPLRFSSFTAGYLEQLGGEDLYTFAAEAGDRVTIAASGSGFSPDLTLVGPDGSIAARGTSDSPITEILPEDGTYAIIVRGSGAAQLGNGPYLLSVSHPRPVAQEIGFGDVRSGVVTVPGDFAEYSFDVAAEHVGLPLSIVHSAVSDSRPNTSYDAVLEL
jgi:hypothetical protein